MGPRASGRRPGSAWRRAAMLVWMPAAVVLSPFWASPVLADQELAVTIKDHRFNPSEVRAKAGESINLKVTNADPTPEEFESGALNREQLIRPGRTVTVRLPALKPGSYDFYGEFNPKTATGRLIVE
jgi:plastocyanin